MAWAQRVLLFGLAGLMLVVFAAPVGAAETTATPCGQACGTSSQTVTRNGAPASPCVRDAGCGGGGALSAGAGSVLVALASTGAVATVLAVRRVRRTRGRNRVSSALLAHRLFHPPRVFLGI